MKHILFLSSLSTFFVAIMNNAVRIKTATNLPNTIMT